MGNWTNDFFNYLFYYKINNKMNKTIHYEDLVNRNKQIDNLKKKGFIIIPKKKFKVVGYILIGTAILTIPIPFTSIPLFILGCAMLGLSYQELLERVRKKIKLMLYNLKGGLNNGR